MENLHDWNAKKTHSVISPLPTTANGDPQRKQNSTKFAMYCQESLNHSFFFAAKSALLAALLTAPAKIVLFLHTITQNFM